jgi:hypothetical protein
MLKVLGGTAVITAAGVLKMPSFVAVAPEVVFVRIEQEQ